MGRVYLVGAGPGAADLLTVRAVRIIESAQILFYDALVGTEIVALAARAEKVAVGKRCGRHGTAQNFINKRLAHAARRHARVVRLKGGDAMLFARAQEEIDYLREAGVEVEVVPGVTAALAAAASLQVSLTRRGIGRSVALATPRAGPGERSSDWIRPVLAADTAVIYMGAGEAHAIARSLVDAGLDPQTPAAVVQSASLPEETWRLGTLAQLGALAGEVGSGPATIVIGAVLRERLAAARSARRFETARRALP
ncbi:MAG: uroporphyrinogen-III C-methyltransferase [Burkholderiales bacterium]|nr:uroporphyrinogen-III C-methyltransferase [Burkholderiales bacterium]